MSSFQQSLSEAHQIENKLKEVIEQNPNCSVITSQGKGSFSDYDLLVQFKDGSHPDLSIEVKNDKWVHVTGNIAVELFRIVNDSKRDTCLTVTKSDAYAYFFKNKFHLIETSTLKRLVQDKNIKVVTGGDGNRARCALLPVKTFLKHAMIFE